MALYTRIAAVTGANKGIGFAIVRNLALAYPASPLNNGPLLIYLTARDKSRGEAAIDAIHSDPQLRNAKALRAQGGLTDVRYHPLDISSGPSITKFSSFLNHEHPDGIDVLVNNAGIAIDGFDPSVVERTLDCNYYGTLALTEKILPSIRQSGRIVNVSSLASRLNKYSPALTQAFREAREVDEVTTLMNDFQTAVKAGDYAEKGWPGTAYCVSKAGLNGMTKVLGRQIAQGNGVVAQARGLGHELGHGVATGVSINAVDPGYVNTDMTKGRGRKSPDQGAMGPVHVALQDIQGANGEYWENSEVTPW